MSDLKRHPQDLVDGLSMMSPFHKEKNSQHPGQNYFYMQNNNPDLLLRQNFIQQQQTGNMFNQQQQLFSQQQQQQNQIGGNGTLFPQQVLSNNFFQHQNQQQQSQQLQQQASLQAPLFNLAFKSVNQQQQAGQQVQQNQQLQHQQQYQTSLSQQSSTQSQESSENQRKSGEKALQYFQTFLQLTQNINDSDLNLDFVKDIYTLKMDSLPSNKEMHDIYHRIVSKQGYSKQQKKNWNDQETNLLVWIILKSCAFKRIDFRSISDDVWEDISCMMVGRSAEQCKLKWLSMSKLNLQQQPWCDQEDGILKKIIKEYEQKNKQNKWSEIAVKLNQLSQKNVFRQGKQCRERWNNHLDPSINRGPWNYEEELIMLKLVLEKGKRWSEISKSMKSQRTENAVKNRYNSLIKKEKGTTSSNTLSSTNDLKANQDISESEKVQITIMIEKLESRIKNGFSLTLHASSNTLKPHNELIEEEADEEGRLQYEEEDEEDDDDDDPGQSQSMQSQFNAHHIKAEEGHNTSQQQQLSLFSNNSKNITSPDSQQGSGKQKNNVKKNILQSKQALFQMVECEAKIKSEQNLNQSDNQIESGTLINTNNAPQNSGGIFKPINQEINIPGDMNLYQINVMNQSNIKTQMNEETISENNSPNITNKILLQQQPFIFGSNLGFNSKPGSKRVSLNTGSLFMDGGNSSLNQIKLPSTPLITGFNHFDMKSQKIQSDIHIKQTSKKNMKKDEFEEEITRSQLVYVDKQTKKIYVITPQFIQQKIQDDFQRNIAVFNQLLQNQEAVINTPKQHGVNTINTQIHPNAAAAFQGSAASISMFLNTPPLQSQSNVHLNQGNQISSVLQGETTPNLFQQYYNFHPSISNSNLGNNSPSLFFGYYSGNNTPQQLGLSQITPQNNLQHQQRMINQMPLNSLMQTHTMPNNTNNTNNSAFPKQNNSVLQSAAMLNKQLIHQDVQQLNSTSNNLINSNQIIQQ